jgi:phosphoribosylformimino-5-aminoimidazole carboxamide ribotide isomerase
MRIIPVIDIARGVAVHARRGDRTRYEPIRSALVSGADPLALLRAYGQALAAASVYVADLDAIGGCGDNLDVIAAMAAAEPRLDLLVDAGIRTAHDAGKLLAAGVRKVIVASESLPGLDAAPALLSVLRAERAVFSMDLKDRTVIWQGRADALRDPRDLAARLASLGFREVILLELDRIGTRRGADPGLVADLTRAAPRVGVIVGGGIGAATELLLLRDAGASGVLLATALHEGTITPKRLHELGLVR